MSKTHRLAVLASQAGSTFEHVARACQHGRLDAQVALLIASNDKAGALERARNLGIDARIISPKNFSSAEDWDRAMVAALREAGPDLILLAGYMRKLGPQVMAEFKGRIVNTHPSLLPKYGGQGMYGRFVHDAVIAAQDSVTGVSFHLVTENYDEGQVLRQVRVPVEPGDTSASLEERVKAAEKDFLIEVLGDLFAGRLRLP